MKKILIIILAIAFCFIMFDKMSAETSNWAKDSNKHYNISKILIIKNHKDKVSFYSNILLNEEITAKEKSTRNIQIPSKSTTKEYIRFCELKFA